VHLCDKNCPSECLASSVYTQPPLQWAPGLCARGGGGVKRPECGADHPPPSRAKSEGRVELYLYFLSFLPLESWEGRLLSLPSM